MANSPFRRAFEDGHIVRIVLNHHDETGVALITFFRVFTLAVTVTFLSCVYVTVSARVLWFELSAGIALWDRAMQP